MRLLIQIIEPVLTFFRGPTFCALADDVLDVRKLKARNTYLSAQVQVRRLCGHFGRVRVASITEAHWNRYVLEQQAAKPGRKMYDDRKYMRIVMLYALRNGHVKRKVRLPIPDRPSRVGREIQRTEIRKLILCAGANLRLQIELAWKMGLRLREMLRLRWDQVDWKRKVIVLLPADTKTAYGREVPINPDVFPRLQRLHRKSKSAFVFPCPGDPSRPQNNNKTAWRRCKRKAGVRARWHDWRHTCATNMLRKGVARHVARAMLGMSEKVLADIYAHLDVADRWKAARKMSGRA